MARTEKSKGLIRAMSRTASASGKTRPSEGARRPIEPSACERCGAVFRYRVWRRAAPPSHALLGRARWTLCPACKQSRDATYVGRVRIVGPTARAEEALIRRRVENVARTAASTQPERRVVSVEWDDDALEILTTSQKLAHRLVHELKKILGGDATYRWSDDGSLYATWEPRQSRGARRSGVVA